MRRALIGALLAAGCAGSPAQPATETPTSVDTAPAPAPLPSAPSTAAPAAAPASVSSPAPVAPRGPEPTGNAELSVHVERGRRQPLALTGTVESIRPPQGSSGLDAWSEITLLAAGRRERFYLLTSPTGLGLPFAVGHTISAEIDCRKGGWHRVCDAIVRDSQRNVLLIVSGSGSDELVPGWTIERGNVATSEVRPGPSKSVRNTHSLRFVSNGASVTAMPHQWRRLVVHGKSFLVTGFEETWDGVRPPDARDHRAFSIVLER